MEAVAKSKYLHSSARKLRLVADAVRGQSVEVALARLFAMKKTKKSARLVDKTLKSAVSNCREKNASVSVDTKALMVKRIFVDMGPKIKRIRPRAQGRAYRIERKLSHLTVEVSD